FQAEDGIRDYKVTGVQTCALPISHLANRVRHRELLRLPPEWPPRCYPLPREPTINSSASSYRPTTVQKASVCPLDCPDTCSLARSEERRVGKEWSSRGGQCQ